MWDVHYMLGTIRLFFFIFNFLPIFLNLPLDLIANFPERLPRHARQNHEEQLQMIQTNIDLIVRTYNHAVGRKILASSFQCSPQWYNEKFHNAMAIVR